MPSVECTSTTISSGSVSSAITRGTAVVTGGAQGLGRVFAEALAKGGHAVALLDVSDCDSTLDAISSRGGTAIAACGDASDPTDVSAFKSYVNKNLPPVRVLVNNAGISPYATFAETSLEDWHRIMRINLDSAFLLTQAFLDDLIMSGSGRVVNLTSSVVWDFQAKDMTAYTTSKAGIVGLTRALASELGIHGVTVNCIAPGIVLTSNIKERVSTERLEEYRERQSIKTLARPTDLVSALNFLVSEDSCQVTGIVVPVNGGRVAL